MEAILDELAGAVIMAAIILGMITSLGWPGRSSQRDEQDTWIIVDEDGLEHTFTGDVHAVDLAHVQKCELEKRR